MHKCDDFFKALSDDTRQKLLRMLEKSEMNVGEIAKNLKTTQPNASHHLNVLRAAGLVVNTRRGQQIYYSLNKDWLKKCCGDFLSMFECCIDYFNTHKIVKRKFGKNT